jgi:iron complex transport system substrate-binding protein
VTQVLKHLPKTPRVLALTPKSLAGIQENILEVGRATGCFKEAEVIIATGRERLERIPVGARKAPRPRVFCMEWIDPVLLAHLIHPESECFSSGDFPSTAYARIG